MQTAEQRPSSVYIVCSHSSVIKKTLFGVIIKSMVGFAESKRSLLKATLYRGEMRSVPMKYSQMVLFTLHDDRRIL